MKILSRIIITICAIIVAVVASVQAHATSVSEADVRQCAMELFQRAAGGACGNFFSLEAVRKVDARESGSDANIIADIDFRVKRRVGGSSPAATQCTGNAWKVEIKNPYQPNTGQWFMYQSQADMAGGYLEPNRGLRVRKNFHFEKWESGWRCAEQSMSPLMLVWDNIQSSPALTNENSYGDGAGDQSVGSANSAEKLTRITLNREIHAPSEKEGWQIVLKTIEIYKDVMRFDFTITDVSIPVLKALRLEMPENYKSLMYLTDNLGNKYSIISVDGIPMAPKYKLLTRGLFGKGKPLQYSYIFDAPQKGANTFSLYDSQLVVKDIAIKPQPDAGQGARGLATATFDCVRSDNPRVTTTLVVDFTSSSVKSLNGFGGLGTGVSAEITDATISWRNRVIRNYGGGGFLTFAGSIDRATRTFTFTASDNSTYTFKCH
jgi:hypothetical protein